MISQEDIKNFSARITGGLIGPARNYLESQDWFVELFRQPLVRGFNRLFYLLRKNTFDCTTFMGKHILKFPTDLWNYQEIIFEKKPDVIIESGVFLGGSTYYFAKLLEIMGHGRLYAIDTTLAHADPELGAMKHVQLIQGDSKDPDVIAYLRSQIGPDETVMVILDSDHETEHVHKEMGLYADLVTDGQYLVVEDGIIEETYPWFHRQGPLKAIRRFIDDNDAFEVDHYRGRFLLSHNPSGYLLKNGKLRDDFKSEADCYRPTRLWLPDHEFPQDMRWLQKLNQNLGMKLHPPPSA